MDSLKISSAANKEKIDKLTQQVKEQGEELERLRKVEGVNKILNEKVQSDER